MPYDANGRWLMDRSSDAGYASDFDEGSADIPIWGWLTGANARRDAARNEATQRRQEGAWSDLLGTAPAADDLAVDYQQEGLTDEMGSLAGGPSQLEGFRQNRAAVEALRRMQELSRGEMTASDRAQQYQMREGTAQQLRSNNQAALQQAQARGMGGGGSQLAAQLSGAESLASQRGSQDAGLQQAIMQRALGAMQGAGSLGMQMSGQDLARRNALDAYNQQQLDWRRQRGSRNTGLSNQTRESRSAANQQAYENRERGAAGITNQWQQGQGNRRADAARKDRADQSAAGVLGTVLSTVLGG